ncbi:MAG: disulfide bond formation protein B [Alphaproteobacteria bacterium]|nr:disulfide bond formation protein B [Rickettsiales bacterium]
MLLDNIKKVYQKPLVFLAVVNFTTIIGILGANLATFFGYEPCMLCHIQRFISFSIAILSSLTFVMYGITGNKKQVSFFAVFICYNAIVSHLFAWYQLLVEKGTIPLPSVCRYGNLNSIVGISVQDLLQKKVAAPCNKPEYIMGFSIAEIALIGTGLVSILAVLFLFNYGKDRLNRIKN